MLRDCSGGEDRTEDGVAVGWVMAKVASGIGAGTRGQTTPIDVNSLSKS
jgi:hypothetical protein